MYGKQPWDIRRGVARLPLRDRHAAQVLPTKSVPSVIQVPSDVIDPCWELCRSDIQTSRVSEDVRRENCPEIGQNLPPSKDWVRKRDSAAYGRQIPRLLRKNSARSNWSRSLPIACCCGLALTGECPVRMSTSQGRPRSSRQSDMELGSWMSRFESELPAHCTARTSYAS